MLRKVSVVKGEGLKGEGLKTREGEEEWSSEGK